MEGTFPELYTRFVFIYITPFLSQKFSNERSLSDRISISVNAINTILPQLNSDAQFNGKYQ